LVAVGGPLVSVVFARYLEPVEIAGVAAAPEALGWSGDWSVTTNRPLGFAFCAEGEPDWEWAYPNEDESGDEALRLDPSVRQRFADHAAAPNGRP